MKFINRFFSMVLLMCMSTMFNSCNTDTDAPLSPITASFSNDSVNIVIGEKFTQTITTNCSKATIVYTSSDQSVATVDPSTGKVTALAKGSTTITATVTAPKDNNEYEGTASASYQVNVDYNVLGTVKIGFGTILSPDFLELITPIVSYRDNDGEHEVRLNNETCQYVKEEYDIGGKSVENELYKWMPSIICNIYETIDFDETISMRFESNKKNIEENRKYKLSASTGVNNVEYSFSYKGALYLGTHTSISLDIKINIGDGETHDDDIYEGESVQKYIDEIVKTKQEFRVEVSKDGSVKVNGK